MRIISFIMKFKFIIVLSGENCANFSENTEKFCYESSLVTEIMNVINSGGDIPTLTANMFSQ